MTDYAQLFEDDRAHFMHPSTHAHDHASGALPGRIITGASGVRIRDHQGCELLDAFAGLYCVNIGYGRTEVADAIHAQATQLAYYHTYVGHSSEAIIELSARIIRDWAPAGMKKVYYGLSGSDANETQVKLVRYYNNVLGRPQKKKIISRQRGYHGVTVAAASLTGLPANHQDFDLPIARIGHVECPHHYRYANPGESEADFATRLADALEQRILQEGPDTVAAFIAEPVMGAGGVIVPPETYFEKIQAVLRKYEVLMVADEVICGFGRTGQMFGSHTFGIQPDILTCAKALSSGYVPISAVMVAPKIYEAMAANSGKIGTFGHGYTYSGHPVAAAVALETLKVYEDEQILAHVNQLSPVFQGRLRGYLERAYVGEARGVGLIGAIELVADKATRQPFDPALKLGYRLAQFAQEEGLIVRAMGDAVALCPPLIITEAEMAEMFARLDRALDKLQATLP
ncbi:MAG: aminotransferase class III-fold pyridoxal phosphate-dependent enzyme [Comamonas sp.]|jgi:adenosylmethionine-8-amino-7-oxononanoate aminotransferase|nr:aminotransferase class III-fold pyridoxal phosphate-dependent enzyme [Comamonas sp.]